MAQKQFDIDKVNRALDFMNDEFWEQAAAFVATFSNQASAITAIIDDTFNKLLVVQYSILEAKYNGYQRLVENKKTSATAKIVKENKAHVAALVEQKSQITIKLSNLLTDLQASIDKAAAMGENEKQKPND